MGAGSMSRRRQLIERIKRYWAALVSRVDKRLTSAAEKQKTGWGSSLEYKRRYTNPDDAKRARTPSDTEPRG